MTEEQFNGLKAGDKFIVEYTVKSTIKEKVQIALADGTSDGTWPFSSELMQNATLVTPPPSLEVGDTVRIVPDPLSGRIHGAHYSQGLSGVTGKVAHVHKAGAKDDDGEVDDECTVWIRCEGHDFNWGVSPHCVVLVKKAAKYRYFVKEGVDSWDVKVGFPTNYGTAVTYSKNNYPNARAAAEAECARLNTEWRKQKGGAE